MNNRNIHKPYSKAPFLGDDYLLFGESQIAWDGHGKVSKFSAPWPEGYRSRTEAHAAASQELRSDGGKISWVNNRPPTPHSFEYGFEYCFLKDQSKRMSRVQKPW